MARRTVSPVMPRKVDVHDGRTAHVAGGGRKPGACAQGRCARAGDRQAQWLALPPVEVGAAALDAPLLSLLGAAEAPWLAGLALFAGIGPLLLE